VRKIASEHAVDITRLEGTGIHSRVTKNDILSHLENRKVAAAPGAERRREASVGRAEPAAAPVPAASGDRGHGPRRSRL
jgi:pyruvate/2-oxoglutarate dehydrogenase complex dihydrolipoamide acyltransferase (E2) component